MNSRQRRVARRKEQRSYAAYLASSAAFCRCSPSFGICASVLAGGLCDRLVDEDDQDYF